MDISWFAFLVSPNCIYIQRKLTLKFVVLPSLTLSLIKWLPVSNRNRYYCQITSPCEGSNGCQRWSLMPGGCSWKDNTVFDKRVGHDCMTELNWTATLPWPNSSTILAPLPISRRTERWTKCSCSSVFQVTWAWWCGQAHQILRIKWGNEQSI